MSLKVQNCIVDEGLDLPESQFTFADLDRLIYYDNIVIVLVFICVQGITILAVNI